MICRPSRCCHHVGPHETSLGCFNRSQVGIACDLEGGLDRGGARAECGGDAPSAQGSCRQQNRHRHTGAFAGSEPRAAFHAWDFHGLYPSSPAPQHLVLEWTGRAPARLRGGSCHPHRLLKERKLTDATNYLRFFWRSGRRRRRSRLASTCGKRLAVARRQRVRLKKRPPSAPNAVRSRYSALKSEACWQDGGVADPATTRSPLR
jgi:hypothetical protein